MSCIEKFTLDLSAKKNELRDDLSLRVTTVFTVLPEPDGRAIFAKVAGGHGLASAQRRHSDPHDRSISCIQNPHVSGRVHRDPAFFFDLIHKFSPGSGPHHDHPTFSLDLKLLTS